MAIELFELVGELKSLKDDKKDYEDKVKTINKRISELEEQIIPKFMEAQELRKVVFDNLGTIYLTPQVRANVKVANRFTVHQWFKDNGFSDLVKETIFAKSLQSWVKERLENGEDIPEGIDKSLSMVARLRRK
jgi:hypothetical protein